MKTIISIALTFSLFVIIFGITDIFDYFKKCKKCKKRFNKQYYSYQYNCGGYECKCENEKTINNE